MNLHTIDKWFVEYSKWVDQARRKESLGLEWVQIDKILGVTYHSRLELDLKAEEMSELCKQERARYLESLKNRPKEENNFEENVYKIRIK